MATHAEMQQLVKKADDLLRRSRAFIDQLDAFSEFLQIRLLHHADRACKLQECQRARLERDAELIER